MLTRYCGLLSSEDLSTLDDFVAGFVKGVTALVT